MNAIVLILMSVTSMLGFWALAWWQWRQAGVLLPEERDRFARPAWEAEAVPGQGAQSPPPDWLFEDSPTGPARHAAPEPRAQPSSDAHTSCFSREELEQTEADAELTAVLDEADLVFEGAPKARETSKTGRSGRTRTLLFPPARS